MKIHLLSAIAFGSLSSVGAADPYAADVPAGMIDVHIEYVEMKAEDATALLDGDDVPSSGLGWHTRLKALLETSTPTRWPISKAPTKS